MNFDLNKNPKTGDLIYWRKSVFRILFKFLFTLGTLIFLIVAYQYIYIEKRYEFGLLTAFGYISLCLCYFFKTKTLNSSIFIFSLVTYYLGIVSLLVVGMLSTGMLFLFSFMVLNAIFMGTKGLFFAIFINLLFFIFVWFDKFLNWQIFYQITPFYTLSQWVCFSAIFLLLSCIVCLTLAKMNKEMNHYVVKLQIMYFNKIEQKKALIIENEALDKFVYSASHDINSPLSNILALSEMAFNETDLSKKNQQILMINKSTVRIKEFISVLLEFSKNKKRILKPEEINFSKKGF